ncbi:copper amine oxidase N-terminal domain-containing protein [Bacilliculturomica massiliensis]|uniref:copper amine oxidase N-terminal domain-containing protein n=1 Tax=Bacilliculturomica massiliensis TaxID=1917867 RepID=UPI00103197D6|nr:copper amine oxidase N-terminal domain-containing protein [Bacilliculturomica massiliensis]
MKLKKVAAAGLSAVMILTGSITAMAADTPAGGPEAGPVSGTETPAGDTAVMPDPGYYLYNVSSKAVIKEINLSDGKETDGADAGEGAAEIGAAESSHILIETVEATPQAIRLNLSDSTVVMDTQTGLPVNRSELKVGQEIYAYYSAAMTRSLPPQSHAEAILVNLDEKSLPAHLLTVEKSSELDGTVSLLAENGTIIVRVAADTPVSPLYTKNIVRNTDIHMGTRIFAWYDIVALSMPGQANAQKVVVLPSEDRDVTIVSEGDIAVGSGKVENGVVMVPLRLTAEKLGFTVTWDGATESVKLTNNEVQTTVKLGEDSYYMSSAKAIGMSKPTALGAAAYEVNGVSWAPAELFNLLLTDGSVRLIGDTLYL